ncbi:MAG: DUF4430 domain-containing protein [Clostridiales bacterium]|nr:DUF4430 domain-containing protein [Clostridiales bacterium]
MKIKAKKIIISTFILGLLIFNFVACTNQSEEEQNQTHQITIIVNEESKVVQVEEDDTVMEIMKNNYQVETEFNDTFITGIDGLVADSNKEFWAFYINDEMSNVGAAEARTQAEDIITFKLTELQ